MRPIHPLQQKLLDTLRRLSETDEGYTYRDLMKEIGASSTSQVSHHLAQLEQKGLLKRDPDDPQNFIIINEAEDAFSFLPLLALASCGYGLDNEQHVIERIPVRSSFIPTQIKDTFLIRAEGDSMKPRINHKDIILVEKFVEGKHNPLGKVVVCEENSECKVKQYAKSDGNVILISFNEKYPPHFVKNMNEFKIHGIVRGVLFASI